MGKASGGKDLLRALYVDFNSFFASCEQQIDPSLRQKPVAVVPSMTDTTSVIAASYEAKAYGIKTGTKVGEAKKMCPGLVCVKGRHDEYVKYHHWLKEVVDSVIPVHAVRSIDEFACELTGSQRDREKAHMLALDIKEKIYHEVGEAMKCSIGIAPNFLLAKIAGDLKKPDGLTIVEAEDIAERIHTLPLQAIPGIGPRMEKRLHEKGIYELQEMMALSQQHTRKIWGSLLGAQMYRLLQGEWIDFRKEAPPKSIGHQHVLPPAKRTPMEAYIVACKLIWKAATRLRKKQMLAQRLSLSVKFINGEKYAREAKFSPTQNSSSFIKFIKAMYREGPRGKRPIKVSVTLYDFVTEQEHQLSLFQAPDRPKLFKAVDALNDRYGRDTVTVGTLHSQKESAPTRIAFQRIPELDEVD